MIKTIHIQKSTIDNSVNFIDETPDVGFFESRYVRRGDDYFIVYLSVQSGCDLGCRMCHLTSTKQTDYINNSIDSLLSQAKDVLEYYQTLVDDGIEKPAKYMHFNFMARGEVLNSPIFQESESAYTALKELRNLAESYQLNARFLLSTIMPKSAENIDLINTFNIIQPYFYYSLYSLEPGFRKKWLHNAMDPYESLNRLKEWSAFSEHSPKIHFALIKGENDDYETISNICDYLEEINFKPDFNFVRYNPFSERYGEEPEERHIQQIATLIRNRLGVNVKVIPRVGSDVKASCGMFIKK
tara:strand:- start:404 stop:1300 length:897 start_codon:yes stop_codon:yes gene_type:complete